LLVITNKIKYLYSVKRKIKKILKESLLRKDYRERMIYGLSLNGETKDEWSLYNSLVSELRKIGDDNHINEIQYRVSDDESPRKVIIEVLNKIGRKNKELKIIEEKIISQFKNRVTEQIRLNRLR
jgi:hypothetical protein